MGRPSRAHVVTYCGYVRTSLIRICICLSRSGEMYIVLVLTVRTKGLPYHIGFRNGTSESGTCGNILWLCPNKSHQNMYLFEPFGRNVHCISLESSDERTTISYRFHKW